ncbi:unnamed protein product [Knipowitschia caucasica]
MCLHHLQSIHNLALHINPALPPLSAREDGGRQESCELILNSYSDNGKVRSMVKFSDSSRGDLVDGCKEDGSTLAGVVTKKNGIKDEKQGKEDCGCSGGCGLDPGCCAQRPTDHAQ